MQFSPRNPAQQGESDTVWIIDPLDGTTNFLHGFPQFCVSVGVQVKGRMEAAAVYDPMRQELFAAARGDGATLDDRKIRVSGRKEMDYALIGTGFPFRQSDADIGPYLEMLGKVVKNTAGVRRPGAAALDLCYVAAGRLDAFWEIRLEALGSRGRVADYPRSRRHRQRPRRQREISGVRPHPVRHTKNLLGPRQTLRARDQGDPRVAIEVPVTVFSVAKQGAGHRIMGDRR